MQFPLTTLEWSLLRRVALALSHSPLSPPPPPLSLGRLARLTSLCCLPARGPRNQLPWVSPRLGQLVIQGLLLFFQRKPVWTSLVCAFVESVGWLVGFSSRSQLDTTIRSYFFPRVDLQREVKWCYGVSVLLFQCCRYIIIYTLSSHSFFVAGLVVFC